MVFPVQTGEKVEMISIYYCTLMYRAHLEEDPVLFEALFEALEGEFEDVVVELTPHIPLDPAPQSSLFDLFTPRVLDEEQDPGLMVVDAVHLVVLVAVAA